MALVLFQSELAPSFEGMQAGWRVSSQPCIVVIVNGYNRRVIVLRSHLLAVVAARAAPRQVKRAREEEDSSPAF